MKRIEIFKPGRYVAISGEALEFSAADLQATAAAYDPQLYEAPLVVGHPKLDAPAYGWAKSLAYGETLDAEPGQVDPAFAEMVNKGYFKRISASFFKPNARNNPKPGVYYLRHIGFLGAAAPAVQGLKSASFAAGNDGVVEFGDFGDLQNAGMWRRLREWIIGKFGLDEADKVIPDYAVGALEADARTEDDSPGATSAPSAFSESQQETTMKPEEIAAIQAENARLKKEADNRATKDAEFSARETALKAGEAKARRDGVIAFAGALTKAGKILPRDEQPLVEFMAALDESTVIEFADGSEQKKLAGSAWLREFLDRLPQQVNYSEHAKAGAGDDKAVSFAAPHGYGVDPVRLELHRKALSHQAANPNVSYDAALAAVAN